MTRFAAVALVLVLMGCESGGGYGGGYYPPPPLVLNPYSPPPAVPAYQPSTFHTYSLPGGRMMSCTTAGGFTSCF